MLGLAVGSGSDGDIVTLNGSSLVSHFVSNLSSSSGLGDSGSSSRSTAGRGVLLAGGLGLLGLGLLSLAGSRDQSSAVGRGQWGAAERGAGRGSTNGSSAAGDGSNRGSGGSSSRGGSGGGCGGTGGARVGGGTSVESGSRNFVVAQRLVDVDLDTGVRVLVQSGTQGTRGRVAATTSNLEVNALGVVLGAVGLASRVQSNDLVTHHIVARLDAAGDGNSVAVVVADEVVGGPGTRNIAVIDQTSSVDLEEFEFGLVNGRAVTVAVSKVGDDRTVVRLGPLSPLQLNLTTSLDRGGDGTGLAILVADDVAAGVGGAINEAIISGILIPADVVGVVGLIVVGVDDESTVVGTVNDSTSHITVTSHQGGRSEDGSSNLGNRHFVVVMIQK